MSAIGATSATVTTRLWLLERGRGSKAVLALACLWCVTGTARVYPHLLPYFNELAGGPDGGNRYLDDSNVSWGESFYHLKRYLDDHHPEDVALEAFEGLDRRAFGIDVPRMNLRDVIWPKEGRTYLVDGSILRRSSLSQQFPGIRFEWLERGYAPVDRVGSIFVYRFSTDRASRDSMHVGADAFDDQAIEQAGRIIARSPEFDEPRTIYAAIRARQAGRLAEAGDLRGALVRRLEGFAMSPRTDALRPLYRARVAETFLAFAASIGEDDEGTERAPAAYLEALIHSREGRELDGIVSLVRAVRMRPAFLPARSLLDQRLEKLGLSRLGGLIASPDRAATGPARVGAERSEPQ